AAPAGRPCARHGRFAGAGRLERTASARHTRYARRRGGPARFGSMGECIMFTGIVEAVVNVCEVQSTTGGIRIAVEMGTLALGDIKIGDSVALDGVCLTVVALAPQRLEFDVSVQTLANTVGFALGAAVNLERSLSLGDRLGGHLVSGHVDGVGRV